MSIRWKSISEIPEYEWVRGYRIGYDEEIPGENKFVVESQRKRMYLKGVNGAVGIVGDEWHSIKLGIGKAGYLQFTVHAVTRSLTLQVHRVGLLAFGPPRPSNKHWALHENDIKTCNNLGNLYWGLPKQNTNDLGRNGHRRDPVGEALPQSKITKADAIEIYRRAMTGESPGKIALDFDIAQSNVSMIKHKKSWRHIHPIEA
jgi:hypothetical protein